MMNIPANATNGFWIGIFSHFLYDSNGPISINSVLIIITKTVDVLSITVSIQTPTISVIRTVTTTPDQLELAISLITPNLSSSLLTIVLINVIRISENIRMNNGIRVNENIKSRFSTLDNIKQRTQLKGERFHE